MLLNLGTSPTEAGSTSRCAACVHIVHSTAWESNAGCGSAARLSQATHVWLAHDVPSREGRGGERKRERKKKKKKKKGRPKGRLAKSNRMQISVLSPNAR